jgi:RNA polymerase sigma-70 factor (ECF subfamily)
LEDFKARANIVGERLNEGRNEALEELISLFQNKIFTIAYRFTGNRDEAFDLSQEIFFRAYSKAKLYKRGTDFNAWFLRLAINTSINYRTKAVKNPSFSATEIDENLEQHPSDEDAAESGINLQKLNKLLNKLPKRERIVLIMQILEERKVGEIAAILNVSVKSVESLLTRARKRLRGLVEKS